MPIPRAQRGDAVYARPYIYIGVLVRLYQVPRGQQVPHFDGSDSVRRRLVCARRGCFMYPMPARILLSKRCNVCAYALLRHHYIASGRHSMQPFDGLFARCRIANHIYRRMPSRRLLRSILARLIPLPRGYVPAHCGATGGCELRCIVHASFARLLCISRWELRADTMPRWFHVSSHQAGRPHPVSAMDY